MARKAFLLRIDPAVLAAVQRWAEDDLRSLNGQIEFVLRQALARRGVKLAPGGEAENPDDAGSRGRPFAPTADLLYHSPMPLADTHVHLLAGLDDGPETPAEALAMCRMLVSEGAGLSTALAHQNPDYPDNTADRLRAAAAELAASLSRKKIPLAVHPTGEIMLGPTTADDWKAGKLLSIGDRGVYLLVEMPHRDFIDVLPLVEAVAPVRLVIAHAERYEPLINDPEKAAAWVAAGCLLQVTAAALADPWHDDMARGIRAWADAGMIHVIGSDGHGIDRRRPLLAAGYRALRQLAGRAAARRAGEEWGAAVLRGDALPVPMPARRRTWFARLCGM